MNNDRKRTTLLLALVGVVGALVIVDQLTGAGDATDETERSTRTNYVRQAELVSRMQSFLDARPQWQEAHNKAEDAWRDLQSRIIAAPTAELANARLQQRISTIANEVGVTVRATSAPTVRTPVDDQPLNVIGVTMSFEVNDPERLYALVDRLENMPDAWTNIRRLSVQGPRRTPRGVADVELEIESLAWITRGGDHAAG